MLKGYIKDAIEKYQCPGCVCGSDIGCGRFTQTDSLACNSHVAGTMAFPGVGSFFLGMPKGFNRLGPRSEAPEEKLKIKIWRNKAHLEETWKYDTYNVPCWKYKNEAGHVFVRGLSPRRNSPFLHVILDGSCYDEIKAIEVNPEEMD